MVHPVFRDELGSAYAFWPHRIKPIWTTLARAVHTILEMQTPHVPSL